MIDLQRLKEGIDRGRLGGNKGLPHGLNRLVEYIPGIQQGTYYLIAGESSTGKSAFANNSFVFNPMDFIIKNYDNIKTRINVQYYSFEISKEMMLYKAICRKIFLNTGILLDVNYILSRGKNRISEEYYKLVISTLSYLEPMQDMVHIYDMPENPTAVFMNTLKHLRDNGDGLGANLEFNGAYKPYNPELYNVILIDHISLLKKEKGFNTKELIDKLSEYLILLRNKFNVTPVVVQQLNRSVNDSARIRLDKIEPMLSDLKDTGNTVADCNTCLALFSPFRYEMEKHRGYKINPDQGGIGPRYRSLSILKNRDGDSDRTIGLKFIGEIGYFEELKKPDYMTIQDYEDVLSIRKSTYN